jgi:rhizosphere induced protein
MKCSSRGITRQPPISATATALQANVAGLASTIYSIDFQNSTPDTWTLSVYQTLPSSPGLKSVSWKQTTVPKSGESGVQWNISYLVGIANYKQQGGKGVYKASQKLSTQLGSKWACRFLDNTQQLFENGSMAAGQVVIENQSGDFANLGIGMDGDLALVQSDVYSGNSAQFEVTPTYWVALYKDVVQGGVISSNQIHGPIQAVFPSGVTRLTHEASVDGKQFVFGLKGGTALVVPLEQVERRLRALAA